MPKILIFGASGNVGREITKAAVKHGFEVTAVIRNAKKLHLFDNINLNHIIADITNVAEIEGITIGFDIVISALGKSVSPNDRSRCTFNDIDLVANSRILDDALKNGVKKFIYISAFHSENYPHLEYFRVHQAFSDKLIASGIDYSILKPPAIFSGFIDMIAMAKKGHLVNIGKGDKRTNPIFEGDLATECINSIHKSNSIIEVGGSHIYTRKQLNAIIQKEVAPQKSIINMPMWLFKCSLPLIKFLDKNTYHKFAFFTEVIQNDTLAPHLGSMSFEEYIKLKNKEKS